VNLNKGLTAGQLDALIGERDHLRFLNAKNEVYRERGMKENPPSRDEAIRLMAGHPNLMKRPLLVKEDVILYGFKEEEWAG
jgi:arsenate reductase-like glutaredoxin family protein